MSSAMVLFEQRCRLTRRAPSPCTFRFVMRVTLNIFKHTVPYTHTQDATWRARDRSGKGVRERCWMQSAWRTAGLQNSGWRAIGCNLDKIQSAHINTHNGFYYHWFANQITFNSDCRRELAVKTHCLTFSQRVVLNETIERTSTENSFEFSAKALMRLYNERGIRRNPLRERNWAQQTTAFETLRLVRFESL